MAQAENGGLSGARCSLISIWAMLADIARHPARCAVGVPADHSTQQLTFALVRVLSFVSLVE